VIARPAGARLQSLCGTARRMRKEEEAAAAAASTQNRRPCRHPAVWACQGNSGRLRSSLARR
jgi:hypothetical protein